MSFLPNIAAASALEADGAYAVPVAVPQGLAPGGLSNVIAIVGATRRGNANVPIGPVTVTSQGGLGPVLAAVGDGILSGAHIPYDAVREAISATPEGTKFVFVPVRDGTDTAATLLVPDATGVASQTFTVGGTRIAGNPLTVTLTPVSGPPVVVTYITGANGDTTNAQAAQQLLNLINLSSAVTGSTAFLQKATLNSLVITATALVSGTASNAIGSTTNTPPGMTLVAGGATFTGGAAPGLYGTATFSDHGSLANGASGVLSLQSGTLAANPVFTYSLAYPYNGQQTWRGIVGYATAGGAFNTAAFIANFAAAFNGALSNQTPSAFAVFTPGSSTSLLPLLGTVQSASGGIDGTAGLTTSSLIGVDGGSRQGMYALRGIPFRRLIFAGCTDPSADVVIEAFLETTGGQAITAFPSGTSLAAAQTAKTAYALSNHRVSRVMDWMYAPDVLAGQQSALVSPLGAHAGVHVSLNPWQSPANKPEGVKKGNAFGTEKTVNNQPVDPQNEGAQRKLLGVNYFTTGMPRTNGLLGIAHGKTSDGSNVADIDMYDLVAASSLAILQRYVGMNQLPPPAPGAFDTDPVRKLIAGDFAALKQTMTGGTDPQLAAFGFQFVGTVTQVQQNYCPWAIQGETLNGIEFAIAEIAVANTVQVAA